MITKLEIKGFKSLVDVSIELGAVNVFIGANGSGKSNLLEAVGFLSSILSNGFDEESLRSRGVRRGTPISFLCSVSAGEASQALWSVNYLLTSYFVTAAPDQKKPSNWKILEESLEIDGRRVFLGDDKEITMFNKADANSDFVVTRSDASESSVKFAEFLSRMNWVKLAGDKGIEVKPAPKEERDESHQITDFQQYLASYAIFSPSTPQLRGLSGDIIRAPLNLGGSGLSQAVDEMLKPNNEKFGPFDLEDVYELIDWADSLTIDETSDQANRLRIGDRFIGKGHKTVSLLESSEGALYVLFLLALVGHPDSPNFFAVDNFDQSLHPRLARALTEKIADQVLADGTRQMLATTHNPLVLDGLDLLDDRIRLFTVDRDSTGATQVKRVLVSEELMAEANNGLSLSRLWLMGRFGGVPKYL